jgi:FkbM family methyltransferase
MTTKFVLLKKLIEFVVICFGIEFWIKFVNLVPLASSELRNRLILSPKARENLRHLDYLGLDYFSNVHDSLNTLARINFNTWESNSRQTFFELCKTADLILDVGAYSGLYSLIGARGSSNAQLIAFEPNPAMREILKKNIYVNGFNERIKVMDFALSDRVGLSILSVGKNTSMARLDLVSNTDFESDDTEMTVEVTTLDDFNLVASSMVMKVDIEGSELAFLRGALNTIASNQPTILMEALTDIDLESQFNLLSNLGYDKPVCMGINTGDERNYLWTPIKA